MGISWARRHKQGIEPTLGKQTKITTMTRRRDYIARELLILTIALCLQRTQGRHVRRTANDVDDYPQSGPRKFGKNPDPKLDPGYGTGYEEDQTIRNGHEIFPIPWFVALQGDTVCAGSLIHGDM
jgi:hypothetical protein